VIAACGKRWRDADEQAKVRLAKLKFLFRLKAHHEAGHAVVRQKALSAAREIPPWCDSLKPGAAPW
jgi:hypothetical protein